MVKFTPMGTLGAAALSLGLAVAAGLAAQAQSAEPLVTSVQPDHATAQAVIEGTCRHARDVVTTRITPCAHRFRSVGRQCSQSMRPQAPDTAKGAPGILIGTYLTAGCPR